MTNLEQQIWELYGSPYNYWCNHCKTIFIPEENADQKHCSICKSMIGSHKIDIGLAHVMQLLYKKISTITPIIENLDPRKYLKNSYYFHLRDGNKFLWKLLNDNNEAALFRDQSEETQRAILEVGKQ